MSEKLTATKLKDIGVRIVKTAAFAFLGVVASVGATGTVVLDFSDTTLALAIVAALVAVQNLFVSPASTLGRSLSTFYQVFFGTWAASGFDFTVGAVYAALAAGYAALLGAGWNFTVKTS